MYVSLGNVVGEIEDPDLLQNRPPIQRALVISAGVLANVLLALVLSIGTASTVGIGMYVCMYGYVCRVMYVCMCMYVWVYSTVY